MSNHTHSAELRRDVTRPGHLVPGWRCSSESVELEMVREAMLEDSAGRRLVAWAALSTLLFVACGVAWLGVTLAAAWR